MNQESVAMNIKKSWIRKNINNKAATLNLYKYAACTTKARKYTTLTQTALVSNLNGVVFFLKEELWYELMLIKLC